MKKNNTLSIKKILFILLIFHLFLISFRVMWITYHRAPDHPQAEKGILDLRGWTFTDKETITLDGQWEFYKNSFLAPDSSIPDKRSYVYIPEKTKGNPPSKFGTYHLRILLPKNSDQLFSIHIQRILTASKVFVNGKLVASAGKPAESPQKYEAKIIPYSASFPSEDDIVDIIIHVSNYDYSSLSENDKIAGLKNYSHTSLSGITKSIKFGTDTAITKQGTNSINWQIITCVILLVHFLYACILYLMDFRKKELIYYALLLLSAIISILFADDKLLLNWISMNNEWHQKLWRLSYGSIPVLTVHFLKSIVLKISERKIFHWLSIFFICFAILTIISPIQYLEYLGKFNLFITIVSFTLSFVLVLQAIRKGEKDTIFLLIALTSCIASNSWGVAQYYRLISLPYYPFEILIAMSAFAIFWFKHFIRVSNQNIELAVKLQQADKEKDDFLAKTSHELRNPLHGIINIAQSIVSKETNSHKKDLELLIAIGRRMSFTLNDLLDISRLKEQRITLNQREISIQAISPGVIDMLHFMIGDKKIKFVLNIPSNFPKIFVDENRFIQILFNLLHNAVKHTEEGSITIKAEAVEQFAVIHIEDTGVGIKNEIIENIFNPYMQGNHSFSSEGIGLGLSICKELVELHGGNLTAKSVLGKGSVFSFTVPLANNCTEQQQSEVAVTKVTDLIKDTAITPADTVQIPKLNKFRPRLLIVDDDPINLKILSNILSEKYEVITVTSGKEALSQLEIGEWDLIISDIMMPNMSGYELCTHIRKQFSISELPILLLTARGQPVDIYTGFNSGANDYVIKPVDAIELKSRVHTLISLKQSISRRLSMEAAWLQAQIQPHFLFNTLNTIASLSEIDTTRMIDVLEEFGKYLRKSFDTKNMQPLIPIDHELELVRSYLFIEKERFGDRLEVIWEIDQTIPNLQVPPLSIQPLVENAIRHGILKRRRGGTILIKIVQSTKYNEIVIKDDGVGIDKEKLIEILTHKPDTSRGIGLLNTDRRLKQLYGSGLKIESILNEGTTVRFQIPNKDHSL
ncbi:ATP-binding protein [Metabacillus fastidiosus]|uniref:hybrid sensor histidine kinase/response regulator n=2 Tax=Metabacillus fastidiosus TaxID=1458 RepID=UPI0009EF566D|nr:ATP-binding protein [Metabacillus fastidiosus]MED4460791.1 ATP-binding protein [Metabacillus fastidiosus]